VVHRLLRQRQRKRKKIGPSKQVAELALKDGQLKIAKGEYLGIYNKRQVIPINQTVAGLLKGLPRYPESDALFPGVNGDMVTMAFRRACQQARIPDCRFHDTRHTFGSHLAMEGFNLRTIQQLLGHRDLRMTKRYAHLSAEHLQHAVDRLDVVMGERLEQTTKQGQPG
jgi:integrase